MRYAILLTVGSLLILVIGIGAAYGGINQGYVEPPFGTLRAGPLTIMSLPPCPTMSGAIYGAGRRCGSASPWAVWVIWRGSDNKVHQWQAISMVLNGG